MYVYLFISLYVYKGTNTVHIFLSLFLVCLLCFETLHRRNWTAHPKKWDFTKIDPTNKPKQHPPRVKETIRFTAGLPSPLFPSLTFWGFNSPNWEQVILLYVEKICQSIKLPMLQHVYPKCSSKLPQQLTSNCPGRSGLEVHVAPTSAFSINDLRWLALNIMNQNDSKLHNQRVKYLTLEFHPISFFRFFNHQRYPTLHRPVAYLQAWSRPPINTEEEIPRSLLFTKDWYGLVTFPTDSTKIGWNQLISKWFNVSKQTYKQTWNHWKSPEKSITSSRSRYPLDAARSMIFVSSFLHFEHVKILLWRVGRRQSLWQWCRPRPVIPKIKLATPHIHLKRTSKGLVMRNARSNAQVVVRHIWTAAFCLQWTSNALRCSITMETLGSLVKSSTHWICTLKSNLHN